MKTLRLQRDPADPERLRKPLQLTPDFVLDGLWQGFCVPTLGYVDRHTLRVQHVAMIVILRRKALRGLRGLLFGHRSGPGDELVADHLLGQLLRGAAVRRDDPAALLSPRLFPPGHHSLLSSGPYARCHGGAGSSARGPSCAWVGEMRGGPAGCGRR